MFIKLTPAQSTGVHGWGPRLKTTLTWEDIAENDDIDFDLLMRLEIAPRELRRLNPTVSDWVRFAGCRASHAKAMLAWPAHPIRDLGGDLADVINLKATSKELRAMGVTYDQLRDVGLIPMAMPLLGLTFQGWIDIGLRLEHTREHFTDAHLGLLFHLTRNAVNASFRATRASAAAPAECGA